MIWKEHSPFRTCINRSHDENNVRLLYPWDATISLRTNKQKYRTCSKECLTSLMKACKEVSTAIYTIYCGKKRKKEDHFIHKFWISDTTNQMKSECKRIWTGRRRLPTAYQNNQYYHYPDCKFTMRSPLGWIYDVPSSQ